MAAVFSVKIKNLLPEPRVQLFDSSLLLLILAKKPFCFLEQIRLLQGPPSQVFVAGTAINHVSELENDRNPEWRSESVTWLLGDACL